MAIHWKFKTNFKIYYILFLGGLMVLIATLINNRDIYDISKKEYKDIQLILQDSANYIEQDGVQYNILRPVTKQTYYYDTIIKWEDIHRQR